MIYKYNNHYIDLDDVGHMELQSFFLDGEKALRLIIHRKNGKTFTLSESVKHIKKIDSDEITVSEYPLEKLKRIPNFWLRYHNNKNFIVKRTIVKEGNVEHIDEEITNRN